MKNPTTTPCPERNRYEICDLHRVGPEKILRIRAGVGSHRFIGIWVVVVDKRVFVRSWSLREQGWYQTFLQEPRGRIQIVSKEIKIRAVPTKSDGLKNAVDRAYLAKYGTGWEAKYGKGLVREPCRGATVELVSMQAMAALK